MTSALPCPAASRGCIFLPLRSRKRKAGDEALPNINFYVDLVAESLKHETFGWVSGRQGRDA